VIKVERLDGSELFLNPHQIELMEERPDTVITMVSGQRVIVKTKVADITEQIIQYRRKIGLSFSSNET